MQQHQVIAPDVKLGKGVKIHHFVNLYGCEIGGGSKIASFVEIRRDVKIGKNCKVEPYSFICEGVTLEDNVFVGAHTCFTNDKLPRACNPDGTMKGAEDWKRVETRVKEGASIGANCSILCGVTIGRHAMVGAGSVVTRDIPDYALAYGVPAKVVGEVKDKNALLK